MQFINLQMNIHYFTFLPSFCNHSSHRQIHTVGGACPQSCCFLPFPRGQNPTTDGDKTSVSAPASSSTSSNLRSFQIHLAVYLAGVSPIAGSLLIYFPTASIGTISGLHLNTETIKSDSQNKSSCETSSLHSCVNSMQEMHFSPTH